MIPASTIRTTFVPDKANKKAYTHLNWYYIQAKLILDHIP